MLKVDEKGIGRAAAKYLLERGSFAAYGFVHAQGKPLFSLKRAEGFAETLARKKVSQIFYCTEPLTRGQSALIQWIKDLPKPAAVFAAFDDQAIGVINACREARLQIPKDITILGAGDDEVICINCRPTLSSIRIPFENHGYLAARALQAQLMRPITRPKIVTIRENLIISKRQTTNDRVTATALVQDALVFIAAMATNGITVADVVQHLNVSRRLADLRFRESTGKSILQVITETKINTAKKFLCETSLPINEIAERCGFSSANYFKNVFVRSVGMSPRAWRRSGPAQQP